MKKVSIIIPFAKDRGFLNEALESIEKQTYPRELIEVILSQSSGNVSYNINRGVERCTGDLVKYLCDDDWLTPNSIEDSVNGFKNGVDFIHGNAYVYRGFRNYEHIAKIKEPVISDLTGFGFFIHGATLMYKRELFDEIGLFDEELDCAEELDFNLRCLVAGKKIGYVDSFLAHYRIHPKQKSLGIGVNQFLRKQKRIAVREKYK